MLEQEAQRLRVTWKKAQNYYNTFANDFARIRKEFNAGNYEVSFPGWLFDNAGLIESRIIAELSAHEKALASEERSVIVVQNLQRQNELRAETNAAIEERNKQIAKKKMLQSQAKAIKDKEKADREADKAAKKAAALAEQQEKEHAKKREENRKRDAKRREENRNAPSEISIDDVKIINGEPCVPDLKVARALGYGKPSDIRALIKRNESEIMRYRNELPHGTATSSESDTKFWLNEKQIVFVCMRSDTERAGKVRQEIIEVFHSYRHGRLVPATPIINEVIGKTNIVAIKTTG